MKTSGKTALAAIAARKHVFVEKPLTLDLTSARVVADAALRSGLILAVGFTRRFHPSIAELRTRARDGRLGGVVAMVAQHTTSTAQFIAPENWRASAAEAPVAEAIADQRHDALIDELASGLPHQQLLLGKLRVDQQVVNAGKSGHAGLF